MKTNTPLSVRSFALCLALLISAGLGSTRAWSASNNDEDVTDALIPSGQASTQAPAAAVRTLTGTLELWSKPICLAGANCQLPQSLGIRWPIEMKYSVPLGNGTWMVVSQTLASKDWQVRLEQIWVQKPTQEPYIVTQIHLEKSDGSPVAECTRYDSSTAFESLPPGSCAGVDGTIMVGVALSMASGRK